MANELTGAYLSPGALGAAHAALTARDETPGELHWYDSLRLSMASQHAKDGVSEDQWCPLCEGVGVYADGTDCPLCCGSGVCG